MASLSWLARGLAARKSRERPAAPRIEPRRPDADVPSDAGRPDVGTAGTHPAALPAVEKRPSAPAPANESHKTPDARSAATVELPLANVLESVPLLFLSGDAEKLVASAGATSAKVKVPLQRLLAQLPSGRIEFRFDDLRPQIPEEFLSEESRDADQGEVPILLDLSQVVRHLPTEALARRHDQMEVPGAVESELPELVVRPGKRPEETPLRETARLAMAASSMPILPGSALGLEPPGSTKTEDRYQEAPDEILKEVILSGAAPEAGPGAEPVGPAEPLFVRKKVPKPLFKSRGLPPEKQPPTSVEQKASTPIEKRLISAAQRQPPVDEISDLPKPIARPPAQPVARGPAPSMTPALRPPGASHAIGGEATAGMGVAQVQKRLQARLEIRRKPTPPPAVEAKPPTAKPAFVLGPVPVLGVSAPVAAPFEMQFRAGPKAKKPVSSPKAIRIDAPRQQIQPKAPDERTMATRALARWLGMGPGRDILIREIPDILTQLPGVSGAIISDSEALTVARQLPPCISEEAISSSASLLYKRLRHAAAELGGGFTNQTLVGLGQWTLVITFEAPFFLTTVHTSLSVPQRLAMRMRKIARALARLEAARPVG